MNASCALCGAPVENDARRPIWMQQFRAVYSESPWSISAHLSGISRRERLRDAAPPGVCADGSPLPDNGLVKIWFMRNNFQEPSNTQIANHPQNTPAWGFPFHASCWDILTLIRPAEKVDLQSLFNILWSFPVQDGLLNFGHDYGGEARYEMHGGTVPTGDELLLVHGLISQHHRWDPLEMAELIRFVEKETHEEDLIVKTAASYALQGVNIDDQFSRLPEDLLLYIFEHLPSADILQLKLSSRACARVPLVQSFWRSRFYPGGECGAIFEARIYAEILKGKWQSLYHHVKSLRHTSPLMNRERVTKLGCSLWDILDQVNSTSLSGDGEGLDSIRWIDAYVFLNPSETSFLRGSRALHQRSLSVPPGTLSILVSFVEVYSRRYISAIRLETTRAASSTLGYQHSSNELLASTDTEAMAGLHLAQDERGIRGLAILSTSGSVSVWVGDRVGIPVRKLALDPVATTSNRIQYLKAGFDAFKIVSLSISDGCPADKPFSTLSRLDTARWFPSLPTPDLTLLGADCIDDQYFQPEFPITLSLFDGPGQDLRRITGIIVLSDVEDETWGIEFTYPPGTCPVSLGVDDVFADETTRFDLDYVNGEYIRGIKTYYRRRGEFIGFRLYTSKGRNVEFLPDRTEDVPLSELHVESLFPEDGSIVGFCARVSRVWGLIDLGLVCRGNKTAVETAEGEGGSIELLPG